jgi:transposase
MQVLYPRCAGLDVHKDTIVACVRCVSPPMHQEVRSFGSTTTELLALADWLAEHDCSHVAMEATGVYWKPVWHVLEDEFELVLANAAHIRNVPGRKTDVNDAMWIADLLAHGLIRSSFVPPQAIQQLRDLTRTRKQLVREVSQHSLRIQKVLEDANLKLGSVLSDVLGKSGRAMLQAIVAGETDPARLAALAQGTARTKTAELREALRGRISEHHRTMLRLHLQVVDALQHTLAELDTAVGKALAPIRQRARLLTTMPGVSDLTASVVVAAHVYLYQESRGLLRPLPDGSYPLVRHRCGERSCLNPLHLTAGTAPGGTAGMIAVGEPTTSRRIPAVLRIDPRGPEPLEQPGLGKPPLTHHQPVAVLVRRVDCAQPLLRHLQQPLQRVHVLVALLMQDAGQQLSSLVGEQP